MNIFRKSKSLCPICRKIVAADIVEKSGSMFMKKTCSEHGSFEIKIAKYAWYYKGLNIFYDNLYGLDFYKRKNPRVYTSIVVSSKCNLKCPICFTPNFKNKEEDISIDFFAKQLEKIKNKKIFVHLSGGGEPTLRKDLPEFIHLITKSGNVTGLATNGIIIAENFDYLMKLKKAGLKTVYMWIDTIRNEEIHRKMRGGNFIQIKMKALENLKKAKIPVQFFQVVAKGVNENEIEDCLEFSRKNQFISTFRVRGYNFLGKKGFLPEQEFTAADEFIETIANHSKNLFNIEDAYYMQKINLAISAIFNNPRCYRAQVIFVPRNKEKSLRDTFHFKEFSRTLEEFEKIWQENPLRAKRYFLKKYLSRLIRNPKLAYVFAKKRLSRFHWNYSTQKYYLAILANPSYSPLNCDLDRMRQECPNIAFNQDLTKNIPHCLELMLIDTYATQENFKFENWD